MCVTGRTDSKKEEPVKLFGRILNKLGIGGSAASPAAEQPKVVVQASSVPDPVLTTPAAVAQTLVESQPVTVVDVVAQLEQRAAANPQKLNWRTSIVDLLKLLELDSSFSARKELAVELGCPADLMSDSARMNMWLHKTVLAHIAENGGNVPKELLG